YDALIISACLAPTDPVLANNIVKGKFAEKYIPEHVRLVISAESGANDGLGTPFLFLAIYLQRVASPGLAVGQWFYKIMLYQIGLSCLIGTLMAYGSQRLLKLAEKHGWIDKENILSFSISLALLIMGVVSLMGSDDILAVFIAGNVLTWDEWFNKRIQASNFQDVIDALLNLAYFVYVGAIIPFAAYGSMAELTVWKLVLLAVWIMVLRRPPWVMMMYKLIPALKTPLDAWFCAWFGPIGAGAIFYAHIAVIYLGVPEKPLIPIVIFIVLNLISGLFKRRQVVLPDGTPSTITEMVQTNNNNTESTIDMTKLEALSVDLGADPILIETDNLDLKPTKDTDTSPTNLQSQTAVSPDRKYKTGIFGTAIENSPRSIPTSTTSTSTTIEMSTDDVDISNMMPLGPSSMSTTTTGTGNGGIDSLLLDTKQTTQTTMAATDAASTVSMAASTISSLNTPTTTTNPLQLVDGRKKSKLTALNSGLFRFEDVYWGTGEDPTEGVKVLHEVFSRHLGEVEDLIALVKVRVSIEEAAAARFSEMARLSGLPGSAYASISTPTVSQRASMILGLGSSGSRKNSGFISTGNGVTSVGNTPVSTGGILNGIKEFASAVASTTAEWASNAATSASGGGSSDKSDRTVAGAGANMIGGGGVIGNPNFGGIVTGGSNANGTMTNGTDKGGDKNSEALSSDAVNLSASGASGYTEDASSLAPVIRTLREQMMAMAAVHRRHADTLTLAVLSPLTAFVDQHRRALNKKKSEVDSCSKELQRISAEIEALRHQYFFKSKLADEEELKFRKDGESRTKPPPMGPILFGSRSVSAQEFHDIVNVMKKEVRTKSILTPLGLFEGCFIGEDALSHLQAKYPKVPRPDIRSLLQEFVNRRMIAPVVGGVEGKFSAALPYMFGRPLLKSGEPPHVKARKDAEVGRLEYAAAIESSEHTRGALEFHITDYLVSAQEAETYRLSVSKEALLALESAQMFVINEISNTWLPRGHDGLIGSGGSASLGSSTLLESPQPAFGVQHIAARYRTGHLRSPPFVFENYLEGRSPHQVFGIGMEELAKFTRVPVPSVVIKCVAALAESLKSGRSTIDTWILPNQDLTSVQFLRHEMNKAGAMGRGIKSATLKRYSPSVVAGVLRLYFFEAPVSLITHELYEPLKNLYTDDFENFDLETKLTPVKSLLETMTPPHYETLKIFGGYLHELIRTVDPSDDRIPRLCWSLAPTILRPKKETRETLADEAPWRFTRDLILYFPDIMGGPIDLEQMTRLPRTPSPPPDDEQDDLEDEMMMAVGSGRRGNNKNRRSRGASLLELRNSPTTASSSSVAVGSLIDVPGSVKSTISPVKEQSAVTATVEVPIAEEDEEDDDDDDVPGAPIGDMTPNVVDSADARTAMTAGAKVEKPKTTTAGWFPWSKRYTETHTDAEGEIDGPVEATPAPAVESKQKALPPTPLTISTTNTATPVQAPAVITAELINVDSKTVNGASSKVTSPAPSSTPIPTTAVEATLIETETATVSTTSPNGAVAATTTTTTTVTNTTATTTASSVTASATTTATAAVSSIASIASSVMFGTAAALATAVTKSSNSADHRTSVSVLYDNESMEQHEHDVINEDEVASVWAHAVSNDDDEPEFFDGTEVEAPEEDGAVGHDLDEYLKFG
ncbi:hypothetical protein HDU76_001681, partial [Blyttiomyces sp. JEL0837]